MGDAVSPPTIKVDSSYDNGIGKAVIDANIYIVGDLTWYQNQNNFFRQVRNLIIDMTEAPLTTAGIHWQVAQATSLTNIRINMRPKSEANNAQQGVFIENGSGGFMSDIYTDGGRFGFSMGSQQFTSRNLQISNAATGIQLFWDWVWLFMDLKITGCDVGLDMTTGGFSTQAVGSVIVVDSVISATQGILTAYAPGYSSPQSAGSLMVENVDFTGSGQAIAAAGGTSARTILPGGQLVDLFAQGNAWTTAGQALDGQTFNGTTCTFGNTSQQAHTASEQTIQRTLSPIQRPASLTDSSGKWFTRSRPQYETSSAGDFLSAKSSNLKGDGTSGESMAFQIF